MVEVVILSNLTYKITSPNTYDISNIKSHPTYSELLLNTTSPSILNVQDSWVRYLPWQIAAFSKSSLQVSPSLYTNLFWINQIITQSNLVASLGRKPLPVFNLLAVNRNILSQRPA